MKVTADPETRPATAIGAPRQTTPAGAPRRVRGAATLAGDLTSMFGSRIISIVLSFVSVLITTRLLHPVGYGRVAYVTVVAMLIFTITSGWTSTAVARYGREELDERGTLRTTSWSRILIIAPLLVAAMLVIPALKLAGAFPPEFTWVFVWLVVVYGGLLVAAEHVRYLLEASGRMKLSAVGMVCQQAAFVAAVAAVAVSGAPRTPLMVVCLSLAALLGVTIVFGAAVRRTALWPPEFDRDQLRRMLRFSTPLIAFTASQYVIQAVDLIIVRAFKSTAQVGVYAFAYQVFTTLQALATVAPQVLTPLFVSARTARSEALVRRYFERVVPQALFVGSVGVGLVIPILPFVVPALFGTGFEGSVEPLAVLLIGLVLLLLSNLLAPVIVLHEQSRPVAVLNAVGAVINVGADVLLLGPLHAGIVAAAAATAACFLVIGAGYFVVARRCLGLSTRVPVELMAPAIGALVPTVVLGGPEGSIMGISVAFAATAALLSSRDVFAREDADLIDRLNMPAAARRALLRGLAVVAR